jgi:hypothetical protein
MLQIGLHFPFILKSSTFSIILVGVIVDCLHLFDDLLYLAWRVKVLDRLSMNFVGYIVPWFRLFDWFVPALSLVEPRFMLNGRQRQIVDVIILLLYSKDYLSIAIWIICVVYSVSLISTLVV